MNVGDLVSWLDKTGVIVRVYKHKLWRTNQHGVQVNFDKIDPEPFADVMIDGAVKSLPQSELKSVIVN